MVIGGVASKRDDDLDKFVSYLIDISSYSFLVTIDSSNYLLSSPEDPLTRTPDNGTMDAFQEFGRENLLTGEESDSDEGEAPFHIGGVSFVFVPKSGFTLPELQ